MKSSRQSSTPSDGRKFIHRTAVSSQKINDSVYDWVFVQSIFWRFNSDKQRMEVHDWRLFKEELNIWPQSKEEAENYIFEMLKTKAIEEKKDYLKSISTESNEFRLINEEAYIEYWKQNIYRSSDLSSYYVPYKFGQSWFNSPFREGNKTYYLFPDFKQMSKFKENKLIKIYVKCGVMYSDTIIDPELKNREVLPQEKRQGIIKR